MDIETSKKLLQEIRPVINSLKYKEYDTLDASRKKLEMYINKIFGEFSNYKDTLKDISFHPRISFGGMDNSVYMSSWESGRNKTVNLIDTMLEDLELTKLEATSNNSTNSTTSQLPNPNIFIVHGHSEEMKESVARMISKIELVPIILHEQPNKGRTIIEKFTDHSEVNFAVALLSADDFAYSIKEKPEEGKLRARQNVILELGFFIGKLGRDRVVALVEPSDNFEFPSDYQGVIYIPFDKNGNWKFSLTKELMACGYKVDANKLL